MGQTHQWIPTPPVEDHCGPVLIAQGPYTLDPILFVQAPHILDPILIVQGSHTPDLILTEGPKYREVTKKEIK